MPSARIAIDCTDPLRMRVASALLADHRVSRVGLIGRGAPDAWGDRAVSIASPHGWDVSLGVEALGIPEVTLGPEGDVSWAGPTGLARTLGARLENATLAATTVGDRIAGDKRFAFPAPIGWLGGALVDGIYHCPAPGDLASVIAVNGQRTLAVLDSREFLDAALVAGGVLLAAEGHRGPVWDAAERYLELISDLGLVLADTIA